LHQNEVQEIGDPRQVDLGVHFPTLLGAALFINHVLASLLQIERDPIINKAKALPPEDFLAAVKGLDHSCVGDREQLVHIRMMRLQVLDKVFLGHPLQGANGSSLEKGLRLCRYALVRVIVFQVEHIWDLLDVSGEGEIVHVLVDDFEDVGLVRQPLIVVAARVDEQVAPHVLLAALVLQPFTVNHFILQLY